MASLVMKEQLNHFEIKKMIKIRMSRFIGHSENYMNNIFLMGGYKVG
jgi:hypothetical protein